MIATQEVTVEAKSGGALSQVSLFQVLVVGLLVIIALATCINLSYQEELCDRMAADQSLTSEGCQV